MSFCYVLVNFGGPRHLKEVRSFLIELLTDREVIRTSFPRFIEYPLFYFVASKRARKVSEDYRVIGGKSPIYEDTETLKRLLEEKLGAPFITFHRYLKKTHASFIRKVHERKEKKLIVFPLFPQFTYATTGSSAKWFLKYLPKTSVEKMAWVPSYAAHRLFIEAHVARIKESLIKSSVDEKEALFIFSAHGLPKSFVDEGDPYLQECMFSFLEIKKYFPKALSKLSFQSQFGKEEWIRPYTSEVCEQILSFHEGRRHVFFIPLSFTSDHIETLFEIEDAYMPPIRKKGLFAYRVPALNLDQKWLDAIPKIIEDADLVRTETLIRAPQKIRG